MNPRLQMTTSKQFGFAAAARLNRALVEALRGSTRDCETCRDIEKEIDLTADGGEYTEAASFPGKTVQKLDAHFRYHWKQDYELLDRANKRPPS